MIINVTYDSSVASAPAGFKTAVNAAVQFFEATFSSPITVNITFGWGEVGGQPLNPGAIGQSLTTFVNTQFATSPGTLLNFATSPAIVNALISASQSTNPIGGLTELPYAEARLLGKASTIPGVQDGFIGLSSSLTYTFDPNNRVVAGAYDAIGVIEHEISEVLGRIAFAGQPPPQGGSPQYSLLDFFRYSAAGTHTYTPGPGYFSLNGDQLLLPFNNPTNGGDAGDWGQAVSGDAFDAFGQTGVQQTVSTVDLRVLELLGYQISDTAPTPNGTPVTPQTVTSDLQIASGQTLNFDGPHALLVQSGSITNAGSIVDTGVRSQTDVVGVVGTQTNIGFTNQSSGLLTVTATDVAADAVGLEYEGNATNAGKITVTSDQADAWGVMTESPSSQFSNAAGGTLAVQALDHAVGVDFANDGGTFSNNGDIEVTGLHAIGVEGSPTSFNNAGTIHAVGSGAGETSIGYYVQGVPFIPTITNSGTIIADYAIEYAPNPSSTTNVSITNTGTIIGKIALDPSNSQIHNSGTIDGAIFFNDGNDVYDGAAGKQSGGIFLGHGTNTATLGNDGEAIAGGGGADTITGGSGNDFILLFRGNNTIDGGGGFNTLSFATSDLPVTVNLGSGTATAGGTDTIKNIQEVIGSNFGSTLIAGSTAATLVAGSGHDVLTGGAGNDTLIAGAGGDTMTGGGGNNTFIYSSGDHQLVITDFDANGDQDVLKIYGYSSAASIQQQGADTLIVLGGNDSVLLKNTQASSLTAANVVYSATPFALPAAPISTPVFGTTTIHITYDFTVLQNETIDIAGQTVGFSNDLAPIGSGPLGHLIDNFGSVTVSTTKGDVSGSVESGTTSSDRVTNEAGASWVVQDTDAAGLATGIDDTLSAFTNHGAFDVTATGNAIGLNNANQFMTFLNGADGSIDVTSTQGSATGLALQNGNASGIENDGNIVVTGATAAYGIRTERNGSSIITNKGSISAARLQTARPPSQSPSPPEAASRIRGPLQVPRRSWRPSASSTRIPSCTTISP